ncbi:MAG: MBL fold metallo-hydrolase [Candidatus Lernaella stagnicola]|nr:MBL fold metallo-hydrolase [Candidatus Lernaella stagnicola]
MPFERVVGSVYVVGGDAFTYAGDCLTYLVAGPPLVLIDAGANLEVDRLCDNILETGHQPEDIACLLLTHGHVDHIGGAAAMREKTGCRIAAHLDDADAITTGDERRTAANWYGIQLPHLPIDVTLRGDSGEISGVKWLHIPGHTPGSIAAYMDTSAGRVLFGQDVHGPFNAMFQSDIKSWRVSMEKLLALQPDILCEGHFGVFRGREQATRFIRGQLAAHA